MFSSKHYSTVLSYSGHSFLDTFAVFYSEITLVLAIFAALLYLAGNLGKAKSFMEQKAIAISLTTFFSLLLLLQGFLKTPLFCQYEAYNNYLIMTQYNAFLESMVSFSGGFILYFSIRLIKVN
jgi:hypothetical protein